MCSTRVGESRLTGYDMVVLADNPLEKALKDSLPELYVIATKAILR